MISRFRALSSTTSTRIPRMSPAGSSSGFRTGSGAMAKDSSRVKIVPSPGLLLVRMVPPIACTRDATMDIPSPAPW